MHNTYSREERLAEFFRRLAALPPASDVAEARDQVDRTLNEVEDEMTDIPHDPDHWEWDGRLYPAQDDSLRATQNPAVISFRHKYHRTLIGINGAIEIQETRSSEIVLTKPDSDGRRVGNL